MVTPRLSLAPRLVAGSPKRFAQGLGATISTAALVLNFGFGAAAVADGLVAMILVAASFEAVFAFCFGCKIFGLLMRAGVIPEGSCSDCSDIASRQTVGVLGRP